MRVIVSFRALGGDAQPLHAVVGICAVGRTAGWGARHFFGLA
jgi:hypothetical protein